MADEKTRYWLKLDKDFLKSSHIKVIKAMPNGKDYVLFYLSLMLESVENVGHLKFTDLIPYNAEMLASLTDTNVDIVRNAVKIFENLGLMQLLDDGTIYLTQVAEMTGKRSESADRVAKFRENQRQKQIALHVTKCNDNIQSTEYKEQSINNKEDNTDKTALYKEIIDYLNKTINASYKSTTKKTKESINARLKEGFTKEDFITVIDKKFADWGKDEKMSAYLRPETLFGTKFESYLNQVDKTSKAFVYDYGDCEGSL